MTELLTETELIAELSRRLRDAEPDARAEALKTLSELIERARRGSVADTWLASLLARVIEGAEVSGRNTRDPS